MSKIHFTLAAYLLTLASSALSGTTDIEFLISGKDGDQSDLTGMVVTLQPLDGQKIHTQPQATEIKQQQRQFRPFIQVAQSQQTVEFPNADPVAHHVYSFSQPNSFELPLYNKNNLAKHTFSQPGVVVLGCNIHDWMLSYLLVTDAPYFGQIENNRLQLNNISTGRYQLSLWHPAMPKKEPSKVIKLDTETQAVKVQLQQQLSPIVQPAVPDDDFDEAGDY